MAEKNNSEYGYQNPGPQNISANEVIINLPFMSDTEWEKDRTKGNFDYVIIGSSFCAMGFTHQILKSNPAAKILIIERGDYVRPKKFQKLSPLDLGRVEKKTETVHWKISQKTREGEYIKSVRGTNNLFGGRSSFWKAWCPEPTKEEMAEWPYEVIQNLHQYFPAAKKLLKVLPVNKLFGKLQEIIFKKLESPPSESTPSDIEAITKIEHAPLAVIENKCRYGDHQKYSVLGPLLDTLVEKREVKAIIHCLVKRIHHENGRAKFLETSKGNFTLGDAKLILAMSTLPSTTLMLNSFSSSPFKQLGSIGKRFTAHFVSVIYARVPFNNTGMYTLFEEQTQGKLEMAAMYVAGENKESKHQFHIQLTAVTVIDEKPIEDYDTMRNLLKTPSNEQLTSSKGHIVFVCASLGQLDHKNSDNCFCLNADADITCNTTLQVIANDNDNALWDTMDKSTFGILKRLTPIGETIEYWNSDTKGWQSHHPTVKQIRLQGLVHPASTMWIGRDSESPVNLDYQFCGVDNVYLTGGALWPTGASWNPTCAMTAMAMNLADKLNLKIKSKL